MEGKHRDPTHVIELWRQSMKTKLAILAIAGVTLASAAAYAQMNHRGSGEMSGHGDMMGMMAQMHGNMHGGGMQHGGGGPGHGSSHGSASAQPKGDTSPSSLAFNGINAKMHEAMNISYTGNADVDFVRGMIPHHQGAVDMAKTVLAFGKNPEIRKLAEDIIRAQETEIAMMKAWLEKNPR
jgi:hypothetical protein